MHFSTIINGIIKKYVIFEMCAAGTRILLTSVRPKPTQGFTRSDWESRAVPRMREPSSNGNTAF